MSVLSRLAGGPYDVLLADPPWSFRVWEPVTGSGRSASRHYPTMDLASIEALPVAEVAGRDSVLLLWATAPLLLAALDVMKAWSFTYKTVAFTWAKTTRSTVGGWHMGLGYYTRANAEFCLLGRRGGGLPRLDRGVRSLIVAPVREHSRKPDSQYERIEKLFGPDVRRLELFARPPDRLGWDTWGLRGER